MLLDLKKINKVYKLKIIGVIHIGAHLGQEYSAYVDLGIEDMAFFEPQQDLFQQLAQKIPQSSNIKLYNLALGNEVCEKVMHIDSYNQASSSILKPKIHLTQHPHIKFEKKITVNMDKLDNVIKSKKYNFINIDVQGFELEVFKGAEKILNDIDYILAEVNRDEVYEDCTKVEELDEFLLKYNFIRIETNWAGKTWGDAFYIKVDEAIKSKNKPQIKRILKGKNEFNLFYKSFCKIKQIFQK